MLDTFVDFFFTVFSVVATLIGAGGLAIALFLWIGAELFGTPLKVNGVEEPIGWSQRGFLAIFAAACGCLTAAGIWLFSADWVPSAYVSLLTSIPIWAYILFVPSIWLFVTTILITAAGWPELMRSFPRPTGKALFVQKLEWAVMGNGVTCNNLITIAAHDAGVAINQSRLFGPFTRPVLIPWDQLIVEAIEGAAHDLTRLKFGRLEKAALVLPLESWNLIERHQPAKQL
jgi:hypothetical protein